MSEETRKKAYSNRFSNEQFSYGKQIIQKRNKKGKLPFAKLKEVCTIVLKMTLAFGIELQTGLIASTAYGTNCITSHDTADCVMTTGKHMHQSVTCHVGQSYYKLDRNRLLL